MYATQTKYQEYIDYIVEVLKLADVCILYTFCPPKGHYRGTAQYIQRGKNAYGKVYVANNMTHTQTLETIAHELRHIHQYHFGYMKDINDKVLWYDKEYEYIEAEDDDDNNHSNYMAQPWEKDANQFAGSMVKKYKARERQYNKLKEYVGTTRDGTKLYRIRGWK